MRRIVIAKVLILALWALYLGVVLSRPVKHKFNDAAGVEKPVHKKCFRFSTNTKSAAKGAIPPRHAKTTSATEAACVCRAASPIRCGIVTGCQIMEE